MSSDNPIPMVDTSAEVAQLWSELEPAVARVLRSGRFIMGPEVTAFEREFAEYLGVADAVAVNSGTDALVIALQALGIGEDDEVITTPFTFVATGSSILRVGATPVFVDIDEKTFNLDVRAVAESINSRTKALLPVHLFGLAADMSELQRLADDANLLVVEDVAQALSGTDDGRKLGTIGDAATFSFFPSKNLGAYGDGGMVVAKDPDATERARMLRSHGAKKKYFNEILGYNSRLDALQAAILRLKLPRLDRYTQLRNEAAQRYGELLADLPLSLPASRPNCLHSFHQFTVRISAHARDGVQAHLRDRGVASMVYYPKLLSDMPLFESYGTVCENARAATTEVLSLPIWPGISAEQQTRVAEALAEALAG